MHSPVSSILFSFKIPLVITPAPSVPISGVVVPMLIEPVMSPLVIIPRSSVLITTITSQPSPLPELTTVEIVAGSIESGLAVSHRLALVFTPWDEPLTLSVVSITVVELVDLHLDVFPRPPTLLLLHLESYLDHLQSLLEFLILDSDEREARVQLPLEVGLVPLLEVVDGLLGATDFTELHLLGSEFRVDCHKHEVFLGLPEMGHLVRQSLTLLDVPLLPENLDLPQELLDLRVDDVDFLLVLLRYLSLEQGHVLVHLCLLDFLIHYNYLTLEDSHGLLQVPLLVEQLREVNLLLELDSKVVVVALCATC